MLRKGVDSRFVRGEVVLFLGRIKYGKGSGKP
jgi:hypothetical protein